MLRPHDTRAGSSRSTPRRPPHRARSTSVTCSATPTPTSSPATNGWRAREVFYPMGWDDNGLPTERRVQNYYGIRCDPPLALRPRLHAAAPNRPTPPQPIARRNFIELCLTLPRRRAGVRGAWSHLGLSVDWSMTYATVDGDARRTNKLRSCATWPGARPIRRGAEPLGRHVPDRRRTGRARGPGAARRVPPPRLPPQRPRRGRRDRDDPARAARRLCRPRRPPRRRAVPAALRHHGPDAGLRCRRPRLWSPARRSRQGNAASP